MDLFMIILKNALWTLLIFPIVIFGHQILFKEEKQMKLFGAIITWVVAIILLTLREFYGLS